MTFDNFVLLLNKYKTTLNGNTNHTIVQKKDKLIVKYDYKEFGTVEIYKSDIEAGNLIAENAFLCRGKNTKTFKYEDFLFQFWRQVLVPQTVIE